MPTVLIKDQKEGDELKTLQFTIEKGDTLYEGLEKKGKILPHGCLAGSCGACKIIISENPHNLEEPDTIENNTLIAIYENNPHIQGKVVRLSCRSRIKGSVTISHFPHCKKLDD